LLIHVFLLLNIRTFDLPLLEDYPVFWLLFFYDNFLLNWPEEIPEDSYLELWQCYGEAYYQQSSALYEFFIWTYLLQISVEDVSTWDKQLAQPLYWLLTLWSSVYIRRFNISFIVASCLLPVVFYYFFVLTDYLEAIEELLAYIRRIEKNRS